MSGRRKDLTDVQRAEVMEQIASMLREGKTREEINAVMPVNATRMISRVRKELGLPLRPHKVTLMDERIMGLYKEGKRTSEIAAAVGRRDTYVSRSLKRQGVAPSQLTRPVMIIGVGVVPQPKTALKKLRKMFPDVKWTLGRVLNCDQ